MIITISGRRVKRSHKLSGVGQLIKTPQIVRALRRTRAIPGMKAKAPAPWAGSQWSLTEAGEAATKEGNMSEETRVEVPQPRIEVPQRWDRETTETFAVCPFCCRQCFDDSPETCCRHRVGLVIDPETGRGFVGFMGVLSCPCSPDQPARPGFRYCCDCLSIASTDKHFREADYRVQDESPA